MYSILVVEHDLDRRIFLRHSLSQHGYRVLTADNEAKASAALRTAGSEIDAFIVDAVLPGGFGTRLAIAAQGRGVLSLVVYADGTKNGGRRVKVFTPSGLVYRGAVFGIGALVDHLRQTPSGDAIRATKGGGTP